MNTEVRGDRLQLGDLEVEVERKKIKNIHLSVHPPDGRVRLAAPERVGLETLRMYAISKLDWIRKQRSSLRGQEREPAREYLEGESHSVWGESCVLHLEEHDAPPSVEVKAGQMILRVRPGADEAKRRAVVEKWQREQLRVVAEELLRQWQPILGVEVERIYVQRMKTKWGSCHPARRTIRLNSELAKKPRGCLEYIVVHELIHLLEPTHNARFIAVLDRHLPSWQERRRELNRLPLGEPLL